MPSLSSTPSKERSWLNVDNKKDMNSASISLLLDAAELMDRKDAETPKDDLCPSYIPRKKKGHPDLLLLLLNLHDNYRAPQSLYEYLTVRDIVQLSCLSSTIRTRLSEIEYSRCINDRQDYWIPFPGVPGLNLSSSLESEGGLFQHQLASLTAMHRAENSRQEFGTLRGGILGDAPGLGKTITVLALICNTCHKMPVAPKEFWDQGGILNGWKALRANPASRESILKCLRPIRHCLHDVNYFSPPFRDNRFPTIRSFERKVLEQVQHTCSHHERELFRRNLLTLKAGLDPRNRSLLKSEFGSRLLFERSLISSGATLVVVPDALLEHWVEQISQHLNLYMLGNGQDEGVVYIDGLGDITSITRGLKTLRNASGIEGLATAGDLSRHLIVVTSFARCQHEFQREVAANRMEDVELKSRRKRKAEALDADFTSTCPLLQIRWLRLIVDEGHELGTHAASTGVTRFIHEIAAERRWVLSGTPTTGDEDDIDFTSNALDQLQRLLLFLRHPAYGDLPTPSKAPSRYVKQKGHRQVKAIHRKAVAKSKWDSLVKKKFLARHQEGLDELRSVLMEIMVMHRKEDIQLPTPIFRQAEVDVQVPMDVQVEWGNLTGIELTFKIDQYLHSSDFQSLVDQSQAEYILKKIAKAQQDLMQRGGPVSQVGLFSGDELMSKHDLRPIKAVVYSSESNNLLSVTEHIIRQVGMEKVAEMNASDDIGSISSELSRFRHGVRECKVCPVCRQTNAIGSRGRGNRCTSRLMEVLTRDARRVLIEPERIVGTRGVPLHRMNGEPMTKYPISSKFWRVGDRLEVDIRDPHPLLPQRASESVWQSYGSDKCKALARRYEFQGQDWYFGPLPSHEPNEYQVEVQLVKWQECGKFHNHSRWYKGPRLADSPIERVKEDVSVLSLDTKLSHGLDLSFVTHMFLLEPINDAALLEQVTSRAHRLGATGPVVVETVNPFFKLSDEVQTRMETVELLREETFGHSELLPDRQRVLSKEVCQFCFRIFETRRLAEEHEETKCPRNPNNAFLADTFKISSVYREIRPPAPPTAPSFCSNS